MSSERKKKRPAEKAKNKEDIAKSFIVGRVFSWFFQGASSDGLFLFLKESFYQ